MHSKFITLLMLTGFVSQAHGQCGAWDNRMGIANGLLAYARIVAWDPDGTTGPAPERLLASTFFAPLARFSSIATLAEWNGRDWTEFAVPRNGTATAGAILQTLDDDDPTTPTELFALGSFTSIDGVVARGIARRVGATWQPIGAGLPGVSRIIRWDPDGPGPAASELVACGSFVTVDNVTFNRVARWNGTTWVPMGAGFTGGSNPSVSVLFVMDFDGPGPQPTRLIAAGMFRNSGPTVVNSIAVWDGTAWTPLGAGFVRTSNSAASVSDLSSWDFDGAGPLPAQLIVGGNMDLSGTTALTGFARWNGTAWIAGAALPANGINSFLQVDLDGQGPQGLTLLAAGRSDFNSGTQLLRWMGSAWSAPIVIGCGSATGCSAEVIGWDHDNSPLTPSRVVASGNFLGTLNEGPRLRLLSWTGGSTTSAFGDGLATGQIQPYSVTDVPNIVVADMDDAGPMPPIVIAAGSFREGGKNRDVRGIGEFVAGEWRPGSNDSGATWSQTSVLASGLWDVDGAGPLLPQLVVSTRFGFGSTTVSRRVGSGLQFLAELRGNEFLGWDADGSGTEPTDLIISVETSSLTGEVWRYRTFAERMGGTFDQAVLALTTWDADAEGPLPDRLVAGGIFTTYNGAPLKSIALWNGTSWEPVGGGMSVVAPATGAASVNAMVSFDFDGPGPGAPELVVTGAFNLAGATSARSLAAWNGQSWREVGGGLTRVTGASPTNSATLLGVDFDGPGPRPQALVVSGSIIAAGNTPVRSIAAFEAGSWQPLASGTGFQIAIRDSDLWDPDGSGTLHPLLVVSGQFDSSTPLRTDGVAVWNTHAPQFIEHPRDAVVQPGETVSLLTTIDCPQPTSFRWMREGMPLSDGLTSSGSVLSGCTSPYLRITNATGADSGFYSVHVSSACGTSISTAAFVDVAGCDDIDFNNNQVFPEDQDVIDFFRVLAGDDCPTCNDIDFNNNQVFPEDQDVIDFFNVLAGGTC